MEKIISDIPLSSDWKIVRLIDEGWSADKKYYIKDNEGFQYLLRISRGQSYKEERHLYSALRELGEIELPVSKLLSSGLCNDGKNTFRLFNWIEGVELLNIVGSLSEEQQYGYGYDSGKILTIVRGDFYRGSIKMGKIISLVVPTQPRLILPNERQNAHGTNITKNVQH